MNKIWVVLVLLLGLMGFGVANAECNAPVDVILPDGATATTEEMVEGQSQVKQYVADAQTFLDCMTEMEKEVAETASEEEKKTNVERYNAVVDKMQSLAEGFNEQIKAYKTAQAEQ